MVVLSVSAKALPIFLLLFVVSLGNTQDTDAEEVLESIKGLQKRVDHLESLLLTSGKEVHSKFEVKLASKLESLENKYDARIQQLESRLDRVLFTRDSSLSKTQLEQVAAEQDSSRNEVTSEFQSFQNDEPVIKAVCSGFAEELKITLRGFESILNSSMVKLQEERDTFSEALTIISDIHSSVNSTRDELVDHRRDWKNVNIKHTHCKEGWHFFENSCYYFSHTVGNWLYGRNQCLAMGGDYVKVSTNNEFNFIASHISSNSWIGLNDIEEEGTLKWISDGTIETEIIQARWHSNQPDNFRGEEDCILFWFVAGKNLWNDGNCGDLLRYICEMEPETSST